MSATDTNPVLEKKFSEIMDFMRNMLDAVVAGTEAPARDLFTAYSKLSQSESGQAEAGEREAAELIQRSLQAFKELSDKIKAAKTPMLDDFTLNTTLSAAHTVAADNIRNCVDANELLLKYMDTSDRSYLEKAAEILKPMTR